MNNASMIVTHTNSKSRQDDLQGAKNMNFSSSGELNPLGLQQQLLLEENKSSTDSLTGEQMRSLSQNYTKPMLVTEIKSKHFQNANILKKITDDPNTLKEAESVDPHQATHLASMVLSQQSKKNEDLENVNILVD